MLIMVHEVCVGGLQDVLVGAMHNFSPTVHIAIERSLARALVELTPACFVAIDRDGRITEFSPNSVEQFGYTQEEAVGRSVNILMPREVAASHDMFMRTYEKMGIVHVLGKKRRVEAMRRGGERFAVDLFIENIRYNDRLEYVGFLANATEAKSLEQAAAVQAVLPQFMTHALIEIDFEGTIVGHNREALREFGLEKLYPPSSINENTISSEGNNNSDRSKTSVSAEDEDACFALRGRSIYEWLPCELQEALRGASAGRWPSGGSARHRGGATETASGTLPHPHSPPSFLPLSSTSLATAAASGAPDKDTRTAASTRPPSTRGGRRICHTPGCPILCILCTLAVVALAARRTR